MAFDEKYQDLGRRIVRAARLAAAVHMYEAADLSDLAQRVVIGGAGPCLVTDDNVTEDDRRRVEPSPRAGGTPHARAPAGGVPPDAARWRG
jgi:hypothetical protein